MNALFGTEIGDPAGTITVYVIVALLVVMGLGLVTLAIWLRRSTKPDPEFLAPLEVMGERSWLKADNVSKRRRLDAARPMGAVPLERSTRPRVITARTEAGPTAAGLDDVRSDDQSGAPAVPGAVVVHRPDTDRRADAGEGQSEPPAPASDTSDEGVADEHTADEHTAGASADADGDGEIDVHGDDADDDATDEDADAGAPTPASTERPIDDFSDNDIDPELIQQAIAELDAELDRGR